MTFLVQEVNRQRTPFEFLRAMGRKTVRWPIIGYGSFSVRL